MKTRRVSSDFYPKSKKRKIAIEKNELSFLEKNRLVLQYDDLFDALRTMKANSHDAFNLIPGTAFRINHQLSEEHLRFYMNCAFDYGLNVASLKMAFISLNKLCISFEGSTNQCIKEINTFIQDKIMDPIWNFHYYQILNPDTPKLKNIQTTIPYQIITKDIVSVMVVPSGLKSVAKLSQTNKQMHSFFQPQLKQAASLALMDSVLKGKKNKVITILESYPDLLFIKTKGTDYSGRMIHGSPWQAMLGAEDADMCSRVKPYFAKVGNGYRLALEQFEEQFPKGSLEIVNTYDFKKLTDGIFDEKEISENSDAIIEQFRKEIMPSDIIKTGKHFDMQILLAALHFYSEHQHGWGQSQRIFFSCKVIGYLERFLPASYAQALSAGLHNILNKNIIKLDSGLPRSLKIDGNNYFFPLDLNPDCRLGMDFLITSNHKAFSKRCIEGKDFYKLLSKLFGLKHKFFLEMEKGIEKAKAIRGMHTVG